MAMLAEVDRGVEDPDGFRSPDDVEMGGAAWRRTAAARRWVRQGSEGGGVRQRGEGVGVSLRRRGTGAAALVLEGDEVGRWEKIGDFLG